jgi:hypothetical protein
MLIFLPGECTCNTQGIYSISFINEFILYIRSELIQNTISTGQSVLSAMILFSMNKSGWGVEIEITM